jgi:hypothetical protein
MRTFSPIACSCRSKCPIKPFLLYLKIGYPEDVLVDIVLTRLPPEKWSKGRPSVSGPSNQEVPLMGLVPRWQLTRRKVEVRAPVQVLDPNYRRALKTPLIWLKRETINETRDVL